MDGSVPRGPDPPRRPRPAGRGASPRCSSSKRPVDARRGRARAPCSRRRGRGGSAPISGSADAVGAGRDRALHRGASSAPGAGPPLRALPVPLRPDRARRYSLSAATVTMLKKLDRPVRIVFFHDPMMRETVELYELIASADPARHRRVLRSGDQSGPGADDGRAIRGQRGAGERGPPAPGPRRSETDIANGILRVSRSATQRVCFLDGHGEPDPFSLESHDHLEGAVGHSPRARRELRAARAARDGQGAPRPRDAELPGGEGLAAAARRRAGRLRRPGGGGAEDRAAAVEVAAVRAYLAAGGNAFLMLDPFLARASSPSLREYGIVVDDDLVIDEASHFWADASSPAVSDYNRHQVTRDLPLSFFPGVRSLSPTPRARAGHLGAAPRELLQAELGAGESGPRRASSRAATCWARTR